MDGQTAFRNRRQLQLHGTINNNTVRYIILLSYGILQHAFHSLCYLLYPNGPKVGVVREGRRQVTTTRNQASGGGDNDLYYQIALNVLPRRLFGTCQ